MDWRETCVSTGVSEVEASVAHVRLVDVGETQLREPDGFQDGWMVTSHVVATSTSQLGSQPAWGREMTDRQMNYIPWVSC